MSRKLRGVEVKTINWNTLLVVNRGAIGLNRTKTDQQMVLPVQGSNSIRQFISLKVYEDIENLFDDYKF